MMNHKLVCARAAREQFASAYRGAVRDYRQARLSTAVLAEPLGQILPDRLALDVLSNVYDPEVALLAWEGSVEKANAGPEAKDVPFRVMARKRPLSEQEMEAKQYDSLSMEQENRAVIIHDGRVHRDGRTLYTVHSRFCLDRVFNEDEKTATVYEEATQPLVRSALEGNRSTFILFGQTGTGKTYTAQGVLEQLTCDLFPEEVSTAVPLTAAESHSGGAEAELAEERLATEAPVAVMCYELAGTRGGREACFDLLAERKTIKCLTGEDGHVHMRGANKIECASRNEFEAVLATAFASRSSESTERNQASSRSHAVIEVQLAGGGCLRVLDLAGSERNYETVMHTRSMAERGGHINYSLLMLKECARIMHRNHKRRLDGHGREQHVPFRSSRLTHLLERCFTDDSHRTVVLATLSPSPTDVEHSLNTLQHVGMMRESRHGRGAELQEGEGGSVAQAGQRGPSSESAGFSRVDGRGHALHSKLQDARKTQLSHKAFSLVTAVGGTIRRNWEGAENMKTEAFIDARWHRELNVQVDESDLWVLREADAEAVQVLDAWRSEQWQAAKSHDLSRWRACDVQDFVQSLELPGTVRIPSTMTGAQLQRLGRRGITALCQNAETAECFWEALMREREADHAATSKHRGSNAKMTALGNHKAYAALEVGQ